ncbi:MAG: aminopeptidase [Thermofilum sp. ex4484_79]|nr:MAG: aminopeptidase [Thermofilum sp. ex4484_79]
MRWLKLGKNFVYPDYKPQWPRDVPYKLVEVDASIDIDFNERKINGMATNRFRLIQNISTISLDAVDMNIRRVYVDGTPAKYNYDGKVLEVSLGSERAKDTVIGVSVEYEVYKPRKGVWFSPINSDQPAKQVWTQGQPEDTRYWLVTYDYPNFKASVTLTITVPEWAYVIANGKLLEKKRTQNKTLWKWRLNEAIPTYLIAFAAGEFSYKEKRIGNLPLIYVVPKGREEDIPRSFSNTPKIIQFFEEYTGVKFPYPKYAQVCVSEFVAGGMENASITILTDQTLHDEKAHIDFSSDPLVSHELAHQWFGDLVTCKDWSNLWLNEGFATLFEALWRRKNLGENEFIYELIKMLDTYISEYSSEYSRPIAMRIYGYPDELFDAHSYPKAALVIWTLHNIIGEENFRKSINVYLNRFKNNVADTEDFRKVVEEVTGIQLDWFFEQFIYNAGHPSLSFKYKWNLDEKMLEITIEQKQKEDSLETYFLPLEIMIISKDYEIKKNINLKEKRRTLYVKLREKPLAVCLDPNFKIFKELTYDLGVEELLGIVRYCKALYPRILAVRKIAEKGGARTVRELYRYLLDEKEFWGYRSEIAKAMAKIGGDTALKTLLESLDKVKHPKVRRAIVTSLGSFRSEDVGKKLTTVLKNKEESYYVRANAATSIAKSKYSGAFKVLKEALTYPSHADVIKRTVLEALGILGTDEALEEIIKYTSDKESVWVIVSAIKALGYFRPTREILDILREKAKNPHPKVRATVLSAIKINLDPKLLPIVNILKNDIAGSIVRNARDVESKITKFMEKGEEYRKLREEIERLREEERRLAERIDRLETKGI